MKGASSHRTHDVTLVVYVTGTLLAAALVDRFQLREWTHVCVAVPLGFIQFVVQSVPKCSTLLAPKSRQRLDCRIGEAVLGNVNGLVKHC